MEDVFVTDRTPNPKKLHTNNSEEDVDFFNYEQKLKEFHSGSPTNLIESKSKFTHPMNEIFNKDFKLAAEKLEGEDQDEEEEFEPLEGEDWFDLSKTHVPE